MVGNMILYEAPLSLLNGCWQQIAKNVKIIGDKGFGMEQA